ncbi:MAG: hypothetical protein WB800_09205 [Streptosporangiaceae bacterium]
MLFVLTGSAGSGKSTALRELAARRDDLAVFDFDDLRPPPNASQSWWQRQIDQQVARAVAEQARGRDTVLAGWLSADEVLAAPAAAGLEGLALCLLDCADEVRLARIESRAASGTWRLHTPAEVAGFLGAAARMRQSATGLFRLDTSTLNAAAVASTLENWMAHARPDRRSQSQPAPTSPRHGWRQVR